MVPGLLHLSPADATAPEGTEGVLCVSSIQDTAGVINAKWGWRWGSFQRG